MKHNIIHFDEIDSTNKYIKSNYNTLDEYTVVETDYQTNGKGRENRVWESNRKDNLMFSILLKPTISSTKLPLISLIVGASMCITINKYIKSLIKWPNDILVNNKKVCGILVEGVFSDKTEAIIPGIGLNVNQDKFSNDLIIKASSLKNEINKEINKYDILNSFLDNFDMLYQDFLRGNNQFIKIVRENNFLKDKEVYYNNKLIKVLDIMDNGNLQILEDNKIKELFFGEVTLSNIYK